MVGAKAEAAATHAEKSAVRYIVFVLDFMSSDLYVTRDLMGCSVLVTVHLLPAFKRHGDGGLADSIRLMS